MDDLNRATEEPAEALADSPLPLSSLFLVFAPLAVGLAAARWTAVEGYALLGVIATFVAAWIWLRRRGEGWRDWGLGTLGARTLGDSILAAAALLFVTSGAADLLERTVGWVPNTEAFDVLRGSVPALVVTLLVAWTTAAFGEELLFRGLLLNGVRRAFGDRVGPGRAAIAGLIVSSVLFGLAHGYQGGAGIVLTGFVGFVLGALFLAGRNLWLPILVHGIYDTVAIVLVFLGLDHAL